MADIRDNLFGLLAVRGHFVTLDQVDEALTLQKQYEETGQNVPRMGELLAHLGYMTPAQIRAVLQGQGPQARGLFGEIGLHWEVFNQADIDSALAHQQELKTEGELPMRIGQIMVSRGIIKPHQIKAILQAQGKSIVQCPNCSVRYNAIRIKAGDRVQCPRCNEQFTPISTTQETEPPEPEFTPNPDQLPNIREELQADLTMEMPAIIVPESKRESDSGRSTIGPYEITEPLGTDYSGTLYKAFHPEQNKVVTIRLFSNELLSGAEDLDRWKMAGQAATALKHPNLQSIISMSSEKDRAYLVMEYIEGESLRQQIEHRTRLPKVEVLNILIQAGEALAYGHARDLIHGNLRPCHMIVESDKRIRLTGLGTPKKIHKDLQLIARNAGTSFIPLYAPPEILIDEQDADERTDIYNLAAIGYHLVTGKAPQAGSDLIHAGFKTALEDILPPTALVAELEPYFSRMLLKALKPNPGDRYESMEQFTTDLKKCRAGILGNLKNLPEIAPENLVGKLRQKKAPRQIYKPRRNFKTHKGKGRKLGLGRMRRGSAYSSAPRRAVEPEPEVFAPEPEPIEQQELGLQEVLFDAPMEPADATKEMIEMIESPPADAVFVPKFSRPLSRRKKLTEEDEHEAHRSQFDAKSVGPDNRSSKRNPNRKKKKAPPENPPRKLSNLALFGIVAGSVLLIGGLALIITEIMKEPYESENTDNSTSTQEPINFNNDTPELLANPKPVINARELKAQKEFGKLLVFSTNNDHKTIIAKLESYLAEFGNLKPTPASVETARILLTKHAQEGASETLTALRAKIERLSNAGHISQASVLLDHWKSRWGPKATQDAAFELQNLIDSQKGSRVTELQKVKIEEVKKIPVAPTPEQNNSESPANDETAKDAQMGDEKKPVKEADNPLTEKGWRIAEGQWSLEGNAIISAPEDGQYARLERPFKLVKSVSVRVRGNASAVGFSFGKDKAFLLRPSTEWQTITLQFNSAVPIIQLNGETRSGLEDVSSVTTATLGNTIALVSLGKAEFEDFKVE